MFLITCGCFAVFLSGSLNARGYLRFLLFAGPFFFLNGASFLYSWYPFATLVSVNTLVLAAGSVMILHSMEKELAIRSLVLGGFVLAVCAVLQHLFVFPSLRGLFAHGQYAVLLGEQSSIPFGSYLYHNMMGGYLAVLFPLSIYLTAHGRTVLWAPVSAVIGAGVVLSSSRIAVSLSMAVAGVYIVSFLMKRQYRRALSVVLIFALCGGGAALLLKAPVSGGGSTVQGVIAEKVRTAGSHLSTMNTRTEIWRNAFNAFRHHPVFGAGAGSFEYAYRRYFDGNSYTKVAHSTVMKTAVELGIAGLLCLCLYIVAVAGGILRYCRTPFACSVAASCGCCLAFSIVDFSFDVPSHVVTFFALTSSYFTGPIFLPNAHGRQRSSERSLSNLCGKALSLSVTLVLLLSLAFTFRAALSEKVLETGTHLEELGLVEGALKSYREGALIMPWNPDGAIKTAAALTRFSMMQTGKDGTNVVREELSGQLEVLRQMKSKDSELHFVKGRGYEVLGKNDEASSAYQSALALYPTSAYYVAGFLSFNIHTGRFDKADRLLADFEPLKQKYLGPYNTRGFYVYRIQDLEAELASRKGDARRALAVAKANLQDAREGKYVITSSRSRQFVEREAFLAYLQKRVERLEDSVASGAVR